MSKTTIERGRSWHSQLLRIAVFATSGSESTPFCFVLSFFWCCFVVVVVVWCATEIICPSALFNSTRFVDFSGDCWFVRGWELVVELGPEKKKFSAVNVVVSCSACNAMTRFQSSVWFSFQLWHQIVA